MLQPVGDLSVRQLLLLHFHGGHQHWPMKGIGSRRCSSSGGAATSSSGISVQVTIVAALLGILRNSWMAESGVDS